jgi:hypothetical protein
LKKSDLHHVLRAASRIVEDNEILVIGSQAVLGNIPEDQLPSEAIRSIEADLVFLNDEDESKSDSVDGAIGELSQFHNLHGYYGQGVSLETPVLPQGIGHVVRKTRSGNWPRN